MAELPPIKLPRANVGDEVVVTSEETGQVWSITSTNKAKTRRRFRAMTAAKPPPVPPPVVVPPPPPPVITPPTTPPVPDGLASGAITLQQAVDRATGPFSVPPRTFTGIVSIRKPVDITFQPGSLLTGTPGNTYAGVLDIRGTHDVVLRGPRVTSTFGAGIYAEDIAFLDIFVPDIGPAGSTGITLLRCPAAGVIGGKLHEANLGKQESTGWHAGGIKVVESPNVSLHDIEAFGNWGPGIWADGRCDGIAITGCRAHDNSHRGIMVEITDGFTVELNKAWRNGASEDSFPPIWATGILVSSSRRGTVRNNISALNAGSDIALISQVRTDDPEPHDLITVTGNVITKPVVQFAEPGAPSTPVTTPNEVVSVDDPRIKALLG